MPRASAAQRPTATINRFASSAVLITLRRRLEEVAGLLCALVGLTLLLALLSHNEADPSWSTASDQPVTNLVGATGAITSDLLLQGFGFAAVLPSLGLLAWAWRLAAHRGVSLFPARLACVLAAIPVLAAAFALLPIAASKAFPAGPGGAAGLILASPLTGRFADWVGGGGTGIAGLVLLAVAVPLCIYGFGLSFGEWRHMGRAAGHTARFSGRHAWRAAGILGRLGIAAGRKGQNFARVAREPTGELASMLRAADAALGGRRGGEAEAALGHDSSAEYLPAEALDRPAPRAVRLGRSEGKASTEESPASLLPGLARVAAAVQPKRSPAAAQPRLNLVESRFTLPGLELLEAPPARRASGPDESALQANARLLETVLDDYGVRGRIADIRPGPVVTLYELEPAPGTKSARVIGLADDIARSMSVLAVRIATVPGRNVIGIELPNAKREMVFFSEMMASEEWSRASGKLPLALGKDIGGAPVIADLARMPHLLIAGTTGSGKSVGINTMILSLLYRFTPDECRFIMIDPKMLELSVYDRIPHLLAPVVTEPPKAIGALKWTVREMERRYRAMSQLGVRNIGGYNEKVLAAQGRGELLTRKVQTGFDPETGKPVFEEQPLALEALPMIVVVIDEMADLMIVAGKEIEAAVQRLAQMARAAGIHVIMATQRPSVDVITGTIKANFPTRISFSVTSKIDSRTILGEQGAEQLLGQGDMLHMAGGGRVARVHGPFVSDAEVERVVDFLREQGEPAYVEEVTEAGEEEEMAQMGVLGGNTDAESSLYDQAVQVVTREGKASTSFIQRHLSIGYNRAAKLIEQMEKEGVVGPANHVGKREVLAPRSEH